MSAPAGGRGGETERETHLQLRDPRLLHLGEIAAGCSVVHEHGSEGGGRAEEGARAGEVAVHVLIEGDLQCRRLQPDERRRGVGGSAHCVGARAGEGVGLRSRRERGREEGRVVE